MTRKPTPTPADSGASSTPVARRGLVAGIGLAAGAAAVAHLAARGGAAPEADPAPAAKKEESAGYRLTAHVQRYYETTKA